MVERGRAVLLFLSPILHEFHVGVAASAEREEKDSGHSLFQTLSQRGLLRPNLLIVSRGGKNGTLGGSLSSLLSGEVSRRDVKESVTVM